MTETKGLIVKRCSIPGRLEHKLAIVTGANTGIGLYTAGELARRGADVVMACRDMQKAEEARKQLLSLYGEANPKWMETDVADSSVTSSLTPIREEQLKLEQLDLASLESVRQFAKRILQSYSKVDYLINNAGLVMDKYLTTEDGFEMTMGVNHLGHFLLTELLLPALKAAAPSRIIILSSMAHYYGQLEKPNLQLSPEQYGTVRAYNGSKLANTMHAIELSKRLAGTGVVAVSVHPGVVATELDRNLNAWYWRIVMKVLKPMNITPWTGAQTTLYTVLTDQLVPGGYYSNCALKTPNTSASDEKELEWFWDKSCELVGLGAT